MNELVDLLIVLSIYISFRLHYFLSGVLFSRLVVYVYLSAKTLSADHNSDIA